MNPNYCIGLLIMLLAAGVAVGQANDPAHSRGGHTDKINAVALSPDGKLVASASVDRTVRVWDTATGANIATLTGKTKVDESDNQVSEEFNSVAFSPDGRMLAVGSKYRVQLLDSRTAKQLKDLGGLCGTISSVAFSPDGRLLAAACDAAGFDSEDEETAAFWDVSTGNKLRSFAGIQTLAFSPDGSVLAAGGRDTLFDLWNVRTGAKIRSVKRKDPSDTAAMLSFGQDGKTLAVMGTKPLDLTDKTSDMIYIEGTEVTIWNVASGLRQNAARKIGAFEFCFFTPNGKYLLRRSALIPDSLKLFDPVIGKVESSFGGESDIGDQAAFDGNGNLLATTSGNGRDIYLFDVVQRKLLRELKGHTLNTLSGVFSADGKFFLGCYDDERVIWWDLKTGEAVKIVEPADGGGSAAFQAAFPRCELTSDGRYYLTAGANNRFRVFDSATGRPASETNLQGQNFRFGGDGKSIADIDQKIVYIRDIPSLTVTSRLTRSDTGSISEFTVSPDGKWMAVINDTSIAVYDTTSGALMKNRELEKGLALDARFSPDGRYLVVEKESLENRSLTVLNARDLSIKYKRYLSAGLFAISSDSKMLALVNEGGKLEFLDLDSGRQLLEGEAAAEGEGGSFELIFNRQTDRLAVLTSRGIRLFDARSGHLIREMK